MLKWNSQLISDITGYYERLISIINQTNETGGSENHISYNFRAII